MMKIFQVQAHWDEETGRWSATSDEILGLYCETDSYKELRDVLMDVVPDLLSANHGYRGIFGLNISAQNAIIVDMPLAAE